jgi:CRP-like cAMP-binding protein
MAVASDRRPHANHLLASLPADEQERLRARLQPVRLNRKQMLQRPGEPIEQVYFPLNGLCSSVASMENGSASEVASVGRDGLVGLSLFLGAESTPFQVFAQIPGEALRMSAAAFREEVERSAALQSLVRRYAAALLVQSAQTAACNRLHPVEQRCARWLLMAHDRLAVNRFQLTHEFFSQFLGVRRSSVTVAAGALQAGGAIRYVYGVITVVSRARLEAAACECYRTIAAEYERLLRFPAG